jgi:hypothetical protein
MARPKVRLNDHAYDGHMQAAVRLTLLLQALAFAAAALSFVPAGRIQTATYPKVRQYG